ncbi:hypothetical protein B7463_g11584, partial [Scytalidium lignicola]
MKIATRDWHPSDHISFASNHPGASPYISTTTVINPSNPSETYESRLWPDHCIQGTSGAQLVPELDRSKIDAVVDKGMRKEVEMYSAFFDPLQKPRISDSGLSGMLKSKGITDVYVVGLAADYCVKFTAIDAAKEGFRTFVIEEGTRAVDPGTWSETKAELSSQRVDVIDMASGELRKVFGG